jgi:tetratricopeptide (TPR) repeat protein
MISEVHYSDESLIAMLESGDEAAISRDPHLASCPTCRDGLEQYRAIVDVLGREAAWDYCDLKDEPEPATVAALRAFATNMQREDEEAETYVAALLDGARETWMPRLHAHPEWRTAGVVRKLANLSYPTLDKMPPDAVEITNLAVEIADHLDPASHVSDTSSRVRGTAWRERAYALFYVGRFPEALAACERADAAFAECVVDEYDRARVAVIRALSLKPLDRIRDGMLLADDAVAVFKKYGDEDRLVSAGMTAAQMHFKLSDYRSALEVLQPLIGLKTNVVPYTRAMLENNIAYCYRHLGDNDASIRHYQICSAILDEIGSITEAVRVRWNIATLLVNVGRAADGLRELTSVRAEFGRLGMASERCLCALEIAELLSIDNRFEEAELLCHETCAQLASSGLGTTSRAMTAIAFLTEAMTSRAATAKLVRHVHEYIRRLPEEPNLLFAPPLQ